MANYREMYVKMAAACEQALRLLIAAQQECEELYISASEGELRIIQKPAENKKSARGVKKAGFCDPALPPRK